MLNEAEMACADKVVRTPRDADIGAIFGIGFPAFRGGPLRMIDDLGAGRVVETLYQLQKQFGERFRPAAALLDMPRRSGRYYPVCPPLARSAPWAGRSWRLPRCSTLCCWC